MNSKDRILNIPIQILVFFFFDSFERINVVVVFINVETRIRMIYLQNQIAFPTDNKVS